MVVENGGAARIGFGSVLEVSEGPSGCSAERGWSAGDATEFIVRHGPNYKKHGRKEPSKPALYDCVGVDLLSSDAVLRQVVAKVETAGLALPDSRDLPALIVINAQIPLSKSVFGKKEDAGLSLVTYHVVSAVEAAKIGTPSEPRNFHLLRRLLERGFSDRSLAWKLIGQARSESGDLPSVVAKTNGTPTLVTESASISSGILPCGARYMEVDFDIRKWSFLARQLITSKLDIAKKLTCSVGYLIEGTDDDDLPEQILCTVRLHHLDPAPLRI